MAVHLHRLVALIVRRLIAVATLVAVAGALAPAAAAPVDRHCAAGHEIAVSVAPTAGCHQAAAALCAAGGCLVAPAALVPVAVIGPSVPASQVIAWSAAAGVAQRLTLGPPTPPPNS